MTGAVSRPVRPADAGPLEAVRRMIGAINAHDPEALRAGHGAEVILRLPERTVRGLDGLVGHVGGLVAALPDLTLTALALGADDEDAVLLRWRVAGTDRGTGLDGRAPTGARVDVDGMDHIVVRGGVVDSHFVVYDRVQTGRELGLLPATGSRVDVVLRTLAAARARRRFRR